MISVLSSFILSLLQAIQSLTDSAQDWMSSRSLAKCSGLEDLCSCVSSANKWYNVLWCLMTWPNGVMYMVNSTGPNTEPWGTPYFNTVGWDALPPANTVWLRSVKYDSSHRSTTPDMPKLSLSLFSSILWSSVSNAADRSRSDRMETVIKRVKRCWQVKQLVLAKFLMTNN